MLSKEPTRDDKRADGEELCVSTAELQAGGAHIVAPASPTLVSAGAEPPPQLGRSRYARGDLVAQRYRLLEPIGNGGAGEVWLAEHVLLHTHVAVKFCLERTGGDTDRAAFTLERFRFEAQVSARLGCKTRHIVLVHDAGQDDKGPFVVMEHAPGRGLDQIIAKEGALAPERVARIVDQIADALSVAHSCGIVHRDIKPGNILIVPGEDGVETAKLADFGIAKGMPMSSPLGFDTPRSTASGVVVGTPDYMSPERVRGRSTVGESADLWALAVVAYEALTGAPPFRRPASPGTMLSILAGAYDPPTKRRPSLPPGVDQWFRSAFHAEPLERFATAKAMSEDLRRALGSAGRTSTRRRRGAAVAALVTTAGVLGALLVPTSLAAPDAHGAPETRRAPTAAAQAQPAPATTECLQPAASTQSPSRRSNHTRP